MREKEKRKWWLTSLRNSFLMAVISFFASNVAEAYVLILDQLSNGYSNCSWRDNGDGTSTANVTVSYKEATGHLGGRPFWSRGILIYTYDKNGVMQPSSAAAKAVVLNGWGYVNSYGGNGYVMYHGYDYSLWRAWGPWGYEVPFMATYQVTINNSYVKDWPAISLRAGNFTSGNDVGELAGGAYLGAGTTNSCTVVNPEKPPSPPILIDMTAPDWNLGELPEGDGEKVFSNSADQLCFTNKGWSVAAKKFVIDASSANGIAENRYRLKNATDASQFVPYRLQLYSDNGSTLVTLPNASNSTISLNDSGKTCFVPVFKTTVGRGLKEGDYSDVLTFTVVTKS